MDESTLFHLHQAQRREGLALAYGRPRVVATAALARDPRRLLGESAEREALIRLILEGHTVERTGGHNARFDLLVDGVLRVEVKAARWTSTTRGSGRYQALFHNRADVLLWLCVNAGAWLVIPTAALGDRRNLAIWSYDPADYRGQWARYLGAWAVIADQVTAAREIGRVVAIQGRLH